MREFAEQLVAYELKQNKSSEAETPAAFLVIEKLRPHLSTLMGNLGFRALLSRALALASAKVPWLLSVHVKPDGSLERSAEQNEQVSPEKILKGGVVLLVELFGLLVVLIGEILTLRLVREVWPKLPLNNFDFTKRK